MEFSVLFWNIWYENQLAGPNGSKKLLTALKRLVDKYEPDIVGLNEVLRDSGKTSPFAMELLKELKYKYVHFTSLGPLSGKWDKGNVICSKYPFEAIREIKLGRNISAERKGFPGHTNKALVADLKIGKKKLRIMNIHPIYLNRHNFVEHYKQMKSLSNLLSQNKNLTNTIVGGDFNEPFHLPRSLKKNFHHKTGTFFNRTWSHKASEKTLLRLNIDRILWSKKGTLALTDFDLINDYTSDHKPLYGRFSI